MGNLVYPSLPGLTFGHSKTPEWKTNIHKAVSGKEFRTAWMSAPLYTFRLQYEFLRDATSYAELQSLIAFFNNCQGSFDSFLFTDPSDKSVTAQSFGTGNGVQTAFQLMRNFGGNLEAVGNLNGAPSIYKSDWQGVQLQYATPRTNLCLFSEQLDATSWVKSDITITANSVVAPDGALTADMLIKGAVVVYDPLYQYCVPLNAGATNTFTFSVWVKSPTLTTVTLILYVAGVGAYGINVPVSTQWACVSFPYTVTNSLANTTNVGVGIRIPNGGELHAWGAQLETGGTKTSYIQTTNSSRQVTDYNISATGVVTFAAAPANAAALTWSGNYYYRCRFLQDSMDFSKFMNALWEAKKVEFIGSLSPNRI